MSFPLPADPTAGSGSPPATSGFVLGPDEGEIYDWLGTVSITKVRGHSSGGGVDVVDHRVPPGYAPPLHVHQRADEIFYLLEGNLEVRCGPDTWEAGPGSLVFLPRGIAHGFTNTADAPARTLLINAPAGFGELVVALGDVTDDLALPPKDAPVPPPERIAQESERYGIGPAPER